MYAISVQTPWEAAAGFWWPDLKEFIANHEAITDWREALVRGHFPAYLADFLNHEEGSIYKHSFRSLLLRFTYLSKSLRRFDDIFLNL